MIENCNLTGSTGSTGFFFQGSCSNVNITNCNFNKCTSTSSGGAVNFYASRQSEVHNNIRIVNCNFTGNYAYYMGGAFEFYAKNSHVKNCTFIGNIARGNRGTMGEGGAFNLYAYADNVKVTNCYFKNNVATKVGGAIASVSSNCRYTDIVNCTFIGNSAPEGGAIKYYSDYTNMTNCSFINNTATVDARLI